MPHSNYQLHPSTDNGGSSFAQDATFCRGLASARHLDADHT
ncbi:AbfB domain-containing protein [Streptomyces longisporus]